MFIECSNLITANPPALSYGVAVADVDGDGRFELLIAGYKGPNRVLKWDGQALVDATPPLFADPDTSAISIAAADLDGDGREEIYILNTDSYGGPKQVMDRLFACFGKRWVDLLALPENFAVANRFSGRSVAAIDRLGTGRYGFVVANFGGPMNLFELDSNGRLDDLAEEVGIDGDAAARSLLCLPLLGEKPDIVVGCEMGPNLLYRNTGEGGFEEVGADLGIADARQNARGLAVLDGDGMFDLALGNWEGAHRLFQQRAGGGFADVAPPELSLPSRVRTVIAADFDNDGHEELFFNNLGEPNRLFAWREERWQQIDIGDAAEPQGLGTGAAVADIDGDGMLELLIAHGETAPQPLSLYLAMPKGHHWLRVMPLTRGGAPARGAVVRLTAGGRTQMRVIDSGSGYLCQMEPVAHFGLGDLRAVERVEIRWPDGAKQTIDSPEPCRMMVVRHPESGGLAG
ncbi:MAG TPA: CRTAC1 family protein [Azospirillaceae bacterium]|nr:CRTAC1 family protein [Azospirillaceae bacterium]